MSDNNLSDLKNICLITNMLSAIQFVDKELADRSVQEEKKAKKKEKKKEKKVLISRSDLAIGYLPLKVHGCMQRSQLST